MPVCHKYDGCIDCKASAQERNRRWRAVHPEYAAQSTKLYREKYPERARASMKRWRESHREYLNEKSKADWPRRKQEKQSFVQEVVGTMCVDCGEDRIAALQYHHPGGNEPKKTLWRLGWNQLKDEVMNVIPLCATCHQVRHQEAA